MDYRLGPLRQTMPSLRNRPLVISRVPGRRPDKTSTKDKARHRGMDIDGHILGPSHNVESMVGHHMALHMAVRNILDEDSLIDKFPHMVHMVLDMI